METKRDGVSKWNKIKKEDNNGQVITDAKSEASTGEVIMAVSPAVKEEFKTTLKVSAYTTPCAGSIKASKKLVGTLAKSATRGKFSLQKTFTKAEMKEILASKANDNISLVNDNGICMSKGKVVNGESVGVGRVSSSVVDSGSSNFIRTSNSKKTSVNIIETNVKTLQECSTIELGVKIAEHQYKHNPSFGSVAGTKSHKKASDFSSKLLKKIREINGTNKR